jgi:hypothetical protein
MVRLLDHQLADYFDSECPAGLLERLLLIIVRAYPTAHDSVWQNFAGPVAHDLMGYHLRAHVENGLGALEGAYPDITVAAVANEGTEGRDGGHNHYEVSFRNTVLTASKIETPSARITEARFRQSLAEISQIALFEVARTSSAGRVWASIVHGPGGPSDRTPGFAKVVFPDQSGSHVGRPHIDLFLRYPALRPTYRDLPTDIDYLETDPRFLPGILPEDKPQDEGE